MAANDAGELEKELQAEAPDILAFAEDLTFKVTDAPAGNVEVHEICPNTGDVIFVS